MPERHDLLVEIGTEELPPKALKSLSEAFHQALLDGLSGAGLAAESSKAYASPRRLAVHAIGVPEGQEDRVVERRGPALAASFDDEGRPTKAAEGFARSCGVTVEDLERLETDKGAWLGHRSVEPGRAAAELLGGLVEQALARLPIPKRMRWGSGEAEFVRPIHWIVLLLGERPVEAEVLGVRAGQETRGHRFHHPAPLYIGEPVTYAPLLETEGRVLPDFEARRAAILGQVEEAAAGLGGRALIDSDLLDEVTALVEWPSAVVGSFDRDFLEVPQEALISAMQGHQKYFAVVDAQHRLLPHFIAISNLESRDPAQVREGNERVIRPRFADAAFFWEQDRKGRLSERRETLKGVVFQQRLGSLYDKTERVARLARSIAGALGLDAAMAAQAAELSKCDLMSQMVGEFPELQGIMGRYYAAHEGYPEPVVRALDEQYMPRHAGDALPDGAIGQVLSLADRLDTLIGIFAIGQRPSGTKDPFGLRRAALGVLRILIEQRLDLDLEDLLRETADILAEQLGADAKRVKGLAGGTAVPETLDYMLERLKAYYADQGLAADTIDAVLARRPTRPRDFDRRVRAVQAFRALPEAESLAAANKRIRNILRQSEGAAPGAVEPSLLTEAAERALADAMGALSTEVESLFDQGDYEPALTRLAGLRVPVDAFFDEVMVMAEDEALRRNRLALLSELSALFLRAADLSRLQQ